MIAPGSPALALAAVVTALVVGGTAGAATTPAPDDRALTVTLQGPGSVTIEPTGTVCTASCTETLEAATEVTLTASPSAGIVFIRWDGVCEDAGPTCAFSLEEDTTVQAVFAAATVVPPPAPPAAPPPATARRPHHRRNLSRPRRRRPA